MSGGDKKENTASALSDKGRERRDFLVSGLAFAGICGLAALADPFIKQLRPDAGETSAAALDVDISGINPGEQILVRWRGQPVVIRNRAAAEIAAAQAVQISDLEDKRARNANLPENAAADDLARSGGKGRENWLVFINVCTHLGCPTEAVPHGWFCPCHGSRYDTAARVIKGPANRNMAIPPYRFLSDKIIRIG